LAYPIGLFISLIIAGYICYSFHSLVLITVSNLIIYIITHSTIYLVNHYYLPANYNF